MNEELGGCAAYAVAWLLLLVALYVAFG